MIVSKNSKILSSDYIFIELKTILLSTFQSTFKGDFFKLSKPDSFPNFSQVYFTLQKHFQDLFFKTFHQTYIFFQDRSDLKIKPNSFLLEFLNRSWASLTV